MKIFLNKKEIFRLTKLLVIIPVLLLVLSAEAQNAAGTSSDTKAVPAQTPGQGIKSATSPINAVKKPTVQATNAAKKPLLGTPNTTGRLKSTTLDDETQAIFDEKADEYKQKLEEKAKNILETDVVQGKYLLFIDITYDYVKLKKAAVLGVDKDINLSSLPAKISNTELERVFVEGLKAINLRNFVKKLDVQVTVDTAITPPQINLLRRTLISGLGIATTKGDVISIKTESLESESAKNKLETADKSLTSIKQENEKLSREKTSAEMSQKQAELKSQMEIKRLQDEKIATELKKGQEETKLIALNAELEKLKKENQTLDEETSVYKTPLGSVKKVVKGLEAVILALVIISGLLLVLWVINTMTKHKSDKMNEAVEILAASLSKIGKNTQGFGRDTLNIGAQEERLGINQSNQNNQGVLGQGGNSNALALSNNNQMAYEELQNLKKEASIAWNECMQHEYLTLAELKEWLASGQDGRLRFMTVLSALNPTDATKLMKSYSTNEIKDLKDIVVDVGSKFLGFSLILSLHRSVLTESMRTIPFLSTLKAPSLVAASDTLLSKALQELNDVERAFILSLLPSKRFLRVMEILGGEPELELSGLFAEIAKNQYPESMEQEQLVKRVEETLSQLIEVEKEAQSRGTMDLIISNMDGFSPRLKAALTTAMNKEESLADEISKRTITFENVLLLENDTLLEFLEPLESEQIAQLMFGLNPQQRNRMATILTGKLMTTVQNDFKRINQSNALRKRAQIVSLQIQTGFIDQMKSMADQGYIEIPRAAKRAS